MQYARLNLELFLEVCKMTTIGLDFELVLEESTL
jgi:hypothetical protein